MSWSTTWPNSILVLLILLQLGCTDNIQHPTVWQMLMQVSCEIICQPYRCNIVFSFGASDRIASCGMNKVSLNLINFFNISLCDENQKKSCTMLKFSWNTILLWASLNLISCCWGVFFYKRMSNSLRCQQTNAARYAQNKTRGIL